LGSWDDLNDSHWDNTADTDALITATAVAMESINDTARPGPLSSNNQPIDAVSSSSSIEETTFQTTSTTMDYSAVSTNASSICMPSATTDVSSSSVIIASAALEESRLALLTTNHCENVLNKRLELFLKKTLERVPSDRRRLFATAIREAKTIYGTIDVKAAELQAKYDEVNGFLVESKFLHKEIESLYPIGCILGAADAAMLSTRRAAEDVIDLTSDPGDDVATHGFAQDNSSSNSRNRSSVLIRHLMNL